MSLLHRIFFTTGDAMKTVVIIGGGASGMMAALTAAENKNNRVLLLERQQRVGRKLLSTGNGRCNLTNTGASAESYHGEHPEFALPALEAFPPEKTLDFFSELGLLTVTEYGGRVYPLSNSANSVVDVLRFALDARGVETYTACPVRELKKRGAGFEIVCDERSFSADCVIVACGGAAGAKLGGVCDGYELLKPLGHKRTGLYPSLVQISTDPTYPRALKGVRAMCRVSLGNGENELKASEGELQFTETGVSGPAAFDLSRAASTQGKGKVLHIDLLSEYSEQQALAFLKSRRAALPELCAAELFTGALHNRLGRMIVKYAGIDAQKCLHELDDTELLRAAQAAKDFALEVRGTEGMEQAQVTAGGIKTTGFDPQTLESWFVPGLFVCGELLDIDGDCGGYNLQWAWSSGRLAGRLGE